MPQSKTFQKKRLEFLEKLLFEIVELENHGQLDSILTNNTLDYRKCWLSKSGFWLETTQEFDELLIDSMATLKIR